MKHYNSEYFSDSINSIKIMDENEEDKQKTIKLKNLESKFKINIKDKNTNEEVR